MVNRDRILLLLTCFLAGYQVSIGIDALGTFAIACFTIGFGVLLVSCLLIFILGWEVLDYPGVVIISTIIPFALSLGLITEYFAQYQTAYLVFSILGLLAVVATRGIRKSIAVLVLAIIHGIAGLLIFGLPFLIVILGKSNWGFIFVGVGGALMGLLGLLLSFLKTGKVRFPKGIIYRIFPVVLFLATLLFVVGFNLR